MRPAARVLLAVVSLAPGCVAGIATMEDLSRAQVGILTLLLTAAAVAIGLPLLAWEKRVYRRYGRSSRLLGIVNPGLRLRVGRELLEEMHESWDNNAAAVRPYGLRLVDVPQARTQRVFRTPRQSRTRRVTSRTSRGSPPSSDDSEPEPPNLARLERASRRAGGSA